MSAAEVIQFTVFSELKVNAARHMSSGYHCGVKKEQRKRIVDRHRDSLSRHGYHPNALYWSSREIQEIRFEVLAGIGIGNGDSVLDVGLASRISNAGSNVSEPGIWTIRASICRRTCLQRRNPDIPMERFIAAICSIWILRNKVSTG